MVTGWRRAFCTSIPKEKVPKVASTEKQNTNTTTHNNNNNNPKPSSKFGFFSNPTTPRQQSSSPSLRCKSASATAVATPESSLPNSPKLQCKVSTFTNNNTPRLLTLSTPSSPISPSSFSLLKNTLRLTKVSKCGICMQSVKKGQGTAIFTAECSHAFHFPCVASHANKHQILACPVCNTVWKHIPVIPNTKKKIEETKNFKTLRVYNDDEPLMSPVSGFNPIPETDEYDVEDDGKSEFQGFFVKPPSQELDNSRRVEVKLHPEVALLASTKSYQTYAVVLKIRAPSKDGARFRAPLDVATLIDVSSRVDETKLQMMKRAMRLVISSLNSKDRLSIVVLSSVSKRVLPLKRMTPTGRRAASRIVDALTCSGRRGVMMSVHDALKKTAKVLEDRREKNPVSTIMVLSDSREKGVFSTRYSDNPVNVIGFGDTHAPPPEEAIEKCLRGMLSVIVQDFKIQLRVMSGSGPVEILAVYSTTGHSILQGHGLVRIGDLYIEEEKDLLVEIRSSGGAQHVFSVQSSYVNPSTQELVYAKEQGFIVPKPQAVRSSALGIERLRNSHVVTRAIAESRRLLEHGDLSGAQHLLSSARALLLKSSSKANNEFVKGLEAELAEVQMRRQAALMSQRPNVRATTDEKAEPLTPTSAWRAAERLAKLAVMRKSMNRVSDLHGFENAGF